MAETCKRCGRPVDNDAPLVERCIREGSFSCLQIEAAYHRGIARGVEIAKENAGILFRSEPDDTCINWARVDRAVAKEVDHGDA